MSDFPEIKPERICQALRPKPYALTITRSLNQWKCFYAWETSPL